MLGLHFRARAFSSCGEWGPLFIAVRGPLTIVASRCGAQAPDVQAQYLWRTGLVAPRHVGSSQTRARTCVPCIGRQILNHCTTREALLSILNSILFMVWGIVVSSCLFNMLSSFSSKFIEENLKSLLKANMWESTSEFSIVFQLCIFLALSHSLDYSNLKIFNQIR